MNASYTKILNLHNFRLILFSVLFFVSGCQIDQSVSIIKEKLFSEKDELEKDDKITRSKEFQNKEVKKSSIKKELAETNDKVQKNHLEEKSRDGEPNGAISLSQKKTEQTGVLPLKEMGQTRDTESKIVSFFTKFFDDEDSGSLVDKKKSTDFTIQKIEMKANKNTPKADEN